MKSVFYKSLLLSGAFAVFGDAFTLYDAAPAIGLPESYAVKYTAAVKVGYDSNANWSYTDEDDAFYVNASVGASYADMESVNRMRYSLRLGATRYLGLDSEKSPNEKEFTADCALTASLHHAFSKSDTYDASLSLTYSPEPDYASGLTSGYRRGDHINWNLSNVYSHAVDTRWSWSVSLGCSGVEYLESVGKYDNRQNYTAAYGVNYRESSLMTYRASVSYSRQMRDYGYDSDVISATVGFDRSLDPFSAVSFNVGVQTRLYDADDIVSPCMSLAYNRKLSEGLSLRAFLNCSNENTDTYRTYYGTSSQGSSYFKDMTWRFGVSGTYKLSPDVSYVFGAEGMHASYSDGEYGMSDEKRLSLRTYAGMDYGFTPQLLGELRVGYTYYQTQHYGTRDLNRYQISAGLRYNF